MAGYAPLTPEMMQQLMSLQDPYWDAPAYPDYRMGYDPSTMALAPEMDKRLQGVNLDRSALNQYQQEAMRTGPSRYATLADQAQALQAKQAKSEGRAAAAGTRAEAEGELARTGGLSSGARERTARDTQRNVMDLNQQANATLAGNTAQIAAQDEANRMQQLGAVPGMQLQASNFDLGKVKTYGAVRSGDINNQIQENQYHNAFDLSKYNTQGQMWAAKKTAAAQNSGGGSWLCTEAGAWDRGRDRAQLSLFRKYALKQMPELTHFYLMEGSELLHRMKSSGYDFKENVKFVKEILALLDDDGFSEALGLYIGHVVGLLDKYWPECHILTTLRRAS